MKTRHYKKETYKNISHEHKHKYPHKILVNLTQQYITKI